jgi:hypothetical protein
MQPPDYPSAGYTVPMAPAARSLQVPAMLVYLGLAANVVLELADIALVGFYETAVVRVKEGTGTSSDSALVLVGQLLAVAEVLDIVYTAVVFIVWLYQARKNLVTWGIEGLGYGPGWAIGGWFIPFASLVIPKLVVDIVWSGSALPPTWRSASRSSNGLIWSWWLCLLAANYATFFAAGRQTGRDDSAAEIVSYNAPGTLLTIAAAVLATILVQRVTRMQERRQATLDQPWQQTIFPQG